MGSSVGAHGGGQLGTMPSLLEHLKRTLTKEELDDLRNQYADLLGPRSAGFRKLPRAKQLEVLAANIERTTRELHER